MLLRKAETIQVRDYGIRYFESTVLDSGTTPGTTEPATGTGTAQSTPQSSVKKREQSSKRADVSLRYLLTTVTFPYFQPEKHSVCSNDTQDLQIDTLEVQDSLLEKGLTTRTKEPTANSVITSPI